MAFVDVGELKIYHEIHGSGPPVLHISGSGNDLRTSAPALSPLNEHFTGLHYDQRGLGQTSLGAEQPTMADFADDAAGLCEELGWDRCHVVGTSFGGMVALDLAVRHPGLIDRLVLNCTSPGGELASYPLHELEDAAERADTWLSIMDTRYDPEAEEPIPGFGGFLEIMRARVSMEREGDSAIGAARQLEARRHHDVTGDLGTITAPTLVCCGRYDGIAPVANSEAIVAGIGGAELAVFEGGHAFMLQDRTAHRRTIEFLLRH
jgi:3-oxoadipate enol-lactonase